MYEAFFGLREKPFTLLPDPGFLFLSDRHQEALTLLEYGLANQAGFIVLSGDIGVGKTTLMRHLLSRLEGSFTVGLISQTHASLGDLMDWVCAAFGVESASSTRLHLQQSFVDFVVRQYAQGKRTLLVVDEAQNLTTEHLEQLRLLSNINADKDFVLQLMLLGQPQLRDRLREPGLEQFVQRIAASYHLRGLDETETGRYIRHRLEVAGAEEQVFSAEGCGMVYEYANGVPRLINLICDFALVYAYAAGRRVVGPDTVEEVVDAQAGHLLVTLGRAERAVSQGRESSGESRQGLRALRTEEEMTTGPMDAGWSVENPPFRGAGEPSSVTDVSDEEVSATISVAEDEVEAKPLGGAEPETGKASALGKESPRGSGAVAVAEPAAAVPLGVATLRVNTVSASAHDKRAWRDLSASPRESPTEPELEEGADVSAQTITTAAQTPGESSRAGLAFGASSVSILLGAAAAGAAWWVLSDRSGTGDPDGATEQAAAGRWTAESSLGEVLEEPETESTDAAVSPQAGASPETALDQPTLEPQPRRHIAPSDANQGPGESAASVADPIAAVDNGHGAQAPLDALDAPDAPDMADATSQPAFVEPSSDAVDADSRIDEDVAVPSTTIASGGESNDGRPGPDINKMASDLAELGIETAAVGENRLVVDLGDKVQFANGSVTLDAAAENFLAVLALRLAQAPPKQGLVVGHTDHQGGAYVNARLSERRAEAVMSFLLQNGRSSVDWRAEGRGETEPKVPLEQELILGAEANRRIELELVWPEDPSTEEPRS